MGKTAFALNALWHAASRGIPAVFYSFEMSKRSLLQRLIANLASIPLNELRQGDLNEGERRAAGEALECISDTPLRIVQASGKTPFAIQMHAERLREAGKLGIAAVDYIGLVKSEAAADGFNRTRELGQICRQFKDLAALLHIPLLVLSQLSRASETRPDKRPVMSDLRDSGELEEHADLIAFLHRPGYYQRDNPALDLAAEFIMAKQRNGDTPTIQLNFRREFGRFESIELGVSDGKGNTTIFGG
jgi:replicative DNA helicase